MVCSLVISPYPRIPMNGYMILWILGPPVPLLISPRSCCSFVLSNSLISQLFGWQSWFCNSRLLTFLTLPLVSSIPQYSLSFANPVFLSICYGMGFPLSSEIYAIYASCEMCFPAPLTRVSLCHLRRLQNLQRLCGVRPQCNCLPSTLGQLQTHALQLDLES